MAVHQCPKCELRYHDANEVKQHLIDDHDVNPEDLEPHASSSRTDLHVHRDVPVVGRDT